MEHARQQCPSDRRPEKPVLGQPDEAARGTNGRALPQCRCLRVRRIEVAQVIEREPHLRREETRLLFAPRDRAERDMLERRGEPLDDLLAPERRVAPLSAEIHLVAARRQRLDHRLDVAVVAVVQSREEHLHRVLVGPRSPARCVSIRISYTTLRAARRLLETAILAPTSV